MNLAKVVWLAACGFLAASAFADDAAPPAIGGYQFCEAYGPSPRAFVSPVFGADADASASFEQYLAGRYQLHAVHARCFRLGTQREADSFRVQRIELLHWDGWQRVVATSWTPAGAIAGSS